MPRELSDYQKKRAAQNIIERLELREDLSNLSEKLDELFNDAPIEVADSISKEELTELFSEINAGTATNNKISRFLELADSLGIY
ncbi:MAG: hypothetical protein IMY72_13090 [Bacteroidetes bacterium]|nr:hypothetical protein [Bacteroidota bacterium]